MIKIYNLIIKYAEQIVCKIKDKLCFNIGVYDKMLRRKTEAGVGLIVLAYHNVVKEEKNFEFSGMEVEARIFKEQMKYLKKYFDFISLEHAMNYLDTTPEKIKNKVVITFDDGYLDNFEVAAPILKKYNIPATIFVTTEPIKNKSQIWGNAIWTVVTVSKKKVFQIEGVGQVNISTTKDKKRAVGRLKKKIKNFSLEKRDSLLSEIYEDLKALDKKENKSRFKMMTENQVKEISWLGVSIENHTASHPVVSCLNQKELEKEIDDANTFIKKCTGRESRYFAYPYGKKNDFSDDSKEILKKKKIKAAFTLIRGANDHNTDRYEMKRIPVKNVALSEFAGFLLKYI